MSQTNWHPTEALAVAEAKTQELKDYRLNKVRVDLGEKDFPRYWWRAEDRRKAQVWASTKG